MKKLPVCVTINFIFLFEGKELLFLALYFAVNYANVLKINIYFRTDGCRVTKQKAGCVKRRFAQDAYLCKVIRAI